MDENASTAIIPSPPSQAPLQPIVRSFASLRPKREIEPSQRGSWKHMLQAAETELIEPKFALESFPDRYLLKALIPGGREVRVEVSATTAQAPHAIRITGMTDERFTDGESFGYVRKRPVDATFTLPHDADENDVRTEVRHGILHVTIRRLSCVAVDAEATD